MKRPLPRYIPALLWVFLSCCNGSGAQRPTEDSTSAEMMDTTKMGMDSTAKRMDTTSAKADTSKAIAATPQAAPTHGVGSVAYYCPSKMILDQEYFITVSIAKEQLDSLKREVRDEARAMNVHIDSSDVKGDSIQLSPKMKVVLTCSSDYFKKIDSSQAEQEFDQTGKMDWDWLVQPLAVTSNIPVEIRVYGYDIKNGNWVQVNHPVKSFFINVQIDPRTFWDKSITFLGENPKFLLGQILIPLITFFGGLWFGKKKKAA